MNKTLDLKTKEIISEYIEREEFIKQQLGEV